jgi:hypothetical protein
MLGMDAVVVTGSRFCLSIGECRPGRDGEQCLGSKIVAGYTACRLVRSLAGGV